MREKPKTPTSRLEDLPLDVLVKLQEGLESGALDPNLLAQVIYDWRGFLARPNQLPPPDIPHWAIWLILAGRGWGKTRTGAEWVREQVERHGRRRIALVARTAADAREVMIEGESGILEVSPPWFRPIYEPSKRRLTWPNGAIATTYSGDRPDQLRGPQHDAAWADEVASWRYPETLDMILFGLRLGRDPKMVITTTPRPTPLIKRLIKDEMVVTTSGSTFENAANLSAIVLKELRRKYEGTRLGQQELYAAILDDVPGALWNRTLIEDTRKRKVMKDLVRIVVAIDPAVTTDEGSNATGIIVAGVDENEELYILDDLSRRDTPAGWAKTAVDAYHKYDADRIVGEVNNGGDLIGHTIKMVDPNVPFKAVRASRGKYTRAEPVSALYEQDRAHHVGVFPQLEDEMCTWIPGEESPDRMDAMVWAAYDLVIGGSSTIETTANPFYS